MCSGGGRRGAAPRCGEGGIAPSASSRSRPRPEQTPGLRSPPGPASPSMVRSGLGFDSVRELLGPLADLTTRRSRRRSRQPPPRPSLGDGLSRPRRRGSLGPLRQRTHVLVVPRGQVRSRSPHRGRRCRQGCPRHRDGRHERQDRRLSSAWSNQSAHPTRPVRRSDESPHTSGPAGGQLHSPVEDDHPQARGRADARRADDCAAMPRSY
jgi:hypothetical protein